MEQNTAAEALSSYRAAERAYADATFPSFDGDPAVTDETKESVRALHVSLVQARDAYFRAVRDAGWSVPFREWSERKEQLP